MALIVEPGTISIQLGLGDGGGVEDTFNPELVGTGVTEGKLVAVATLLGVGLDTASAVTARPVPPDSVVEVQPMAATKTNRQQNLSARRSFID